MYKYHNTFNETQFGMQTLDELESLKGQLFKLNERMQCNVLFIAKRDGETAQTLIVINKEQVLDNFSYQLDGTPCEKVLDEDICVFPESVGAKFPGDLLLKQMKAESYIGAPIKNDDGRPIGIVAGLFFTSNMKLNQHRLAFDIFSKYLSALINKAYLQKRAQSQLSLHYEVEEISRTGAWEYQVANDKLYWSREVYRIYGLDYQSLVTPELGLSYYCEAEQAEIRTLFLDAVNNGQSYHGEFQLTDAFGVQKWIRTSGKAEKDDGGNVVRVFGAIEDVTAEKQLMLLNEERTQRLDSILNNLNDAVITIDERGNIEHANTTALTMFGYSYDELIATRIEKLMPEPYASQHEHYMQHYAETGEAKIIGVGRQLPAMKKSGEVFQMELSLTTTESQGRINYIGVIRDISERIKAQDVIYKLAYTDSVTELRNGKWFEKECKDLLIRALLEKHCIYCLIVDIDKMSQFNLQFGFEKGDMALKTVAQRIENLIGKEFRLYKHDADSFIVLCTHTYKKSETHRFNTKLTESALLNKMIYDFTIDEQSVGLSASLGSAIFEAQKHSVETILSTLEYALKNAKQYSPFGSHYIGQLGLDEYERTNKIRSLLKNVSTSGELSLMLQPQYTNKECFVSFEALIRWHSAELGHISPADFIPIAEENDAIIEIGDWVLSSACQILQSTIAEGVDMRISVNISAKQIVSSDFISKLVSVTKRWGVPADRLVLELTETTLVADLELVKNTMCELNELGFGFSIDDFGTGYSSLAYLKELPIVELKIDKYFVDDIATNDGKKFAIVDAIIDMAKALGVKSVAEGVENEQQYHYLKKRGCDLYQGYFFSKPLKSDDWWDLLRDKVEVEA